MFEVPNVNWVGLDIPSGVADALQAAGFLCADIATTFHLAETAFAHTALGANRIQLLRGTCVRAVGSQHLWTAWHEAAGFREGVARIYLDALIGYAVVSLRIARQLSTDRRLDEHMIFEALAQGSHVDSVRELAMVPPIGRSHLDDYASRRLRASYAETKCQLCMALDAASQEGLERLGELAQLARTESSEYALRCIVPVSRYAESLHFLVQRLVGQKLMTKGGASPCVHMGECGPRMRGGRSPASWGRGMI